LPCALRLSAVPSQPFSRLQSRGRHGCPPSAHPQRITNFVPPCGLQIPVPRLCTLSRVAVERLL
jgi:hypothetical protein